ncbi:hypothetical protein PIB30_073958 [Stylosanthes scabra]|uniref:Uncharacterized protein n=1 Tax=Stylosanthes scabra TaxID=79078 RepID=A0ABU6QPK7_9FABA|nr:hypothetical protein [Stylosanthes scabra]
MAPHPIAAPASVVPAMSSVAVLKLVAIPSPSLRPSPSAVLTALWGFTVNEVASVSDAHSVLSVCNTSILKGKKRTRKATPNKSSGEGSTETSSKIDTGSDVLWVSCTFCNGCPQRNDLQIPLNFFDPSNSSMSSLMHLEGFEKHILRLGIRNALSGLRISHCRIGNKSEKMEVTIAKANTVLLVY